MNQSRSEYGGAITWREKQISTLPCDRIHDDYIAAIVPSGDDYPGQERLDERRFRLADVARHEKASLIYEYDFGDSWAHEVVVEKILPADPKKKYAVCLDGKNACPPEDCGGIWGYCELLKAVKNPKHKEHRATLHWLGGPLDPGHFDLQKINAELRRMGNLARPSPFLTH
jgi:hypothetical protein